MFILCKCCATREEDEIGLVFLFNTHIYVIHRPFIIYYLKLSHKTSHTEQNSDKNLRFKFISLQIYRQQILSFNRTPPTLSLFCDRGYRFRRCI